VEAAQFADHYQVLGLRRTATASEIRRAYRRLVLRYHPDRGPTDPDAAALFHRITEAYQVLSNADKRRQYDSLLTAYLNAPRPAVPVKKPRSQARPSGITHRLRFEDEQNALADTDALWGACTAAAIFPWMVYQTDFFPQAASFWLCCLVSPVLVVASWTGWMFGQYTGDIWDRMGRFLLRFAEAGEGLAAAAPFLIASLAPYWAAVVLDSLMPLPTLGLAPAVLGGSLAGWVAAAVGRAVVFASDPPGIKRGLAAAVLLALVLGGLAGFLLTAATSDVLSGARFFILWTCSGGSAALGGAIAAARGALRPLGDQP
jgi:hypothetical protein